MNPMKYTVQILLFLSDSDKLVPSAVTSSSTWGADISETGLRERMAMLDGIATVMHEWETVYFYLIGTDR